MTPEFRYSRHGDIYQVFVGGMSIGLVRKLWCNRWQIQPKGTDLWFGQDPVGNILQTRHEAAEALWRRVGGEEGL
jgi:hypothetical protein